MNSSGHSLRALEIQSKVGLGCACIICDRCCDFAGFAFGFIVAANSHAVVSLQTYMSGLSHGPHLLKDLGATLLSHGKFGNVNIPPSSRREKTWQHNPPRPASQVWGGMGVAVFFCDCAWRGWLEGGFACTMFGGVGLVCVSAHIGRILGHLICSRPFVMLVHCLGSLLDRWAYQQATSEVSVDSLLPRLATASPSAKKTFRRLPLPNFNLVDSTPCPILISVVWRFRASVFGVGAVGCSCWLRFCMRVDEDTNKFLALNVARLKLAHSPSQFLRSHRLDRMIQTYGS